jgi:hemerythrin-like domain-containing protein
MKATTLLKRQHRQTEKLFAQIERSRDEVKRNALVEQLVEGLMVHMLLEEQVFYPAVREALEDTMLVEEAFLEHHAARGAMQLMLRGGDELVSFEARLKALKEMIEQHVEEEEEELFPEVESAMDEAALKGVGAEMKELEEQAMQAGVQKLLASVPPSPDLQPLTMDATSVSGNGGAAKADARKSSGAASGKARKSSANGANGARAQARA